MTRWKLGPNIADAPVLTLPEAGRHMQYRLLTAFKLMANTAMRE